MHSGRRIRSLEPAIGPEKAVDSYRIRLDPHPRVTAVAKKRNRRAACPLPLRGRGIFRGGVEHRRDARVRVQQAQGRTPTIFSLQGLVSLSCDSRPAGERRGFPGRGILHRLCGRNTAQGHPAGTMKRGCREFEAKASVAWRTGCPERLPRESHLGGDPRLIAAEIGSDC